MLWCRQDPRSDFVLLDASNARQRDNVTMYIHTGWRCSSSQHCRRVGTHARRFDRRRLDVRILPDIRPMAIGRQIAPRALVADDRILDPRDLRDRRRQLLDLAIRTPVKVEEGQDLHA